MSKSTKNIIFIIIIILVVLGLGVGGFFLFKSLKHQTTPSPTPSPGPTGTSPPSPSGPTGGTGPKVCQKGFEGDNCQCNMSNLANTLSSSWYCGGYYPICNTDGSYSQSVDKKKSCEDLVNSWSRYQPFGTDYTKFNCCGNGSCPGSESCISQCVEGEDGIQSMYSCGCPPQPNSVQCQGCAANQICVCDGTLTNNEWKCITQQNSQCPSIPKNTFCKDASGNQKDPVCIACGTNGYVLVCPGSTPDASLLKCISTNKTPYPVWDSIINKKSSLPNVSISYDSNGIPIYPTFDNRWCPNNPGDGTNAVTDPSGSIQLWKAANNPPGVVASVNGTTYFVPYNFDPKMQSYFYNKYQNYSGTGPSFNICDNQYGESISTSGIYSMCWSGDVPTCQGNTGYNLNQQVLNQDGTIDYLWNCNSEGGQWNQFGCNWNPNIKWTDNTSLPKDVDGKDIVLLPIVGCTYSNFSTGAGETGTAPFNYKVC